MMICSRAQKDLCELVRLIDHTCERLAPLASDITTVQSRSRSSLARRSSTAAALQKYSKFPIPANAPADLRAPLSRYWSRAVAARGRPAPRLNTGDRPLLEPLARQRGVR